MELADEMWELSTRIATSGWTTDALVPLFGALDYEDEEYGLRRLHVRPRDPRFMIVTFQYVEPDNSCGLVSAALATRELTIHQLRTRFGDGTTPAPQVAGCGTARLREPAPAPLFGETTFDAPPAGSSVRATFRDFHDGIWLVEELIWQPAKVRR